MKAELQVRTILMHAWAEIEHKLNYKSDSQVPDKFQRKLFRLSAKFEEADEQFEELREGIRLYRAQLEEKITKYKKFDTNQDFNIDSYKAFLKFNFPNEEIDNFTASHNFEGFSTYKKTFDILQTSLEKVKPYFKEIEKDLIQSGYINNLEKDFPSEELLEISLDITDEESFNRRKNTVFQWRSVVEKWREKIH